LTPKSAVFNKCGKLNLLPAAVFGDLLTKSKRLLWTELSH